jgi:secondary thiamine-phosphate synthase enzyme
MDISLKTAQKRQIIDITEQVEAELLSGGGLVNAFIKHTTAALTVADLDPGTDQDILDAIAAMTPHKTWRHPHDPSHFPDHLWSALLGPSITLSFADGRLLLGSWQRLILIELDGPRQRQIHLTISK